MSERRKWWLRRALVTAAVFIPAGLAFLLISVQVSSQPRFCGSCHFMLPYYESWLTSTHKEVACVECHIPPGIRSEVRKKWEALAMVARYFTATYSTNPWAEVDDASCLRSGCHAKRVLLGRELYAGVLFDHQPHLTKMRREKQLRCTSCHSQIVQGSHISVTPTTCFLCHFKDTPLNEGTARCTLCHTIPDEQITYAGLSFDHGDVERFDMDCVHCHEGVTRGTGEVPPQRCYTCHNDQERLERYEETELLHQIHVTDHKVECLHCHVEITHRIPEREDILAAPCQGCHSGAGGHAAVRDLYRGIGAQGVEPRPAPMYLAGIRCEACHTRHAEEVRRASEVSCMSCHGPKYRTIFRTWQLGLESRLEGLREELQTVRAHLEEEQQPAPELLEQVEHNLRLLERGHAIHNPGYSVRVFERGHRDLSTVMGETGGAAFDSPPWIEAPYESECLQCHFGIERSSGPAFGWEFSHETHTVGAGLRCAVCHTGMDEHGGMRIGEQGCDDCHTRVAGPMAEVSAEECLVCHVAEIEVAPDGPRFPHAQHIEMGFGCDLCHSGVTEMDHIEFADSPGAAPEMGHELCGTCHTGDVMGPDGEMPEDADCAKCHEGF